MEGSGGQRMTKSKLTGQFGWKSMGTSLVCRQTIKLEGVV